MPACLSVCQTEPVERPSLLPGGLIPVSEHGNVEVWGGQPAFVPKGCVHLPLARIHKVATDLGIHCAPALTGR